MDHQKMQYQDFEPFFEWAEDEGSATLIIMLPGFRKDQMKVQVTSTPLLRINGEREITQNLRRRFAKELPIPPYCDTNNVSAKFERGMLFIKFPKMQQAPTPAPSEPQEPEKPQEPTIYKAPLLPTPPNKPEPEPEPEPAAPLKEKEETVNDEKDQKQEKEPISDEKEESQGAAATSGEAVANDDDQKQKPKPEPEPEPEPVGLQKEKEPIRDVKEKGKELASSADGNGQKARARDDYGLSKTSEVAAASSKDAVARKGGAKMAQRLKTRVLDFTLSVRSGGDGNGYDKDDVSCDQCGLATRAIKRPKVLMNVVVSILLVMVLWTYVKNAFRSPRQGGPNFQEL